MKVDLHMHSIYSDGLDTPKQLVLRAKEKGLTHIALTDHDSVEGMKEMQEHCDAHNIKLIKGIELSTYHNDESVHILGYFEDEVSKEILEYSKTQFINRHKRAKDMCDLLELHYNVKMDYNKLKDCKGMITRGGLAYLLMEDNDISEEECRKILSKDSKAYIEAAKLSTKEGIDILKKSNAIVVLAHPTLLKKVDVMDIVNLGVDGLEGIYPLNKDNEELKFIEIAKKNNLIVTAGSDYHGKIDKSHKDMATVYTKELFKRY